MHPWCQGDRECSISRFFQGEKTRLLWDWAMLTTRKADDSRPRGPFHLPPSASHFLLSFTPSQRLRERVEERPKSTLQFTLKWEVMRKDIMVVWPSSCTTNTKPQLSPVVKKREEKLQREKDKRKKKGGSSWPKNLQNSLKNYNL